MMAPMIQITTTIAPKMSLMGESESSLAARRLRMGMLESMVGDVAPLGLSLVSGLSTPGLRPGLHHVAPAGLWCAEAHPTLAGAEAQPTLAEIASYALPSPGLLIASRIVVSAWRFFSR